jgi:hypothetical protein
MYLNKIMITKTFPKVPGIDLCKWKGKNIVFEAGMNEVQRGSKMWLGVDGTYLNSCRQKNKPYSEFIWRV